MRLKTISAAKGEYDIEAQTRVYVDELAAYPADIAVQALRRTRKFFPAWIELEEDCQKAVRARRMIIAALERAVAQGGISPPAAGIPSPTRERRREIVEAVLAAARKLGGADEANQEAP